MALFNYTLPFPFRDGHTISGVDIDTAFNDIKTAVNANALDKDNFRPIAGIKNEQKANSFSYVPATITIPSITQAANTTKRFKGLFAYPHYAQFEISPSDRSGADGSISTANSTAPKVFQVLSVEGCYHGAANMDVGDSINAYVVSREYLKSATATVTQVIGTSTTGNNVFLPNPYALNINKPTCDYVSLDIEIVTSAVAGTRTFRNIICTVWLALPHAA